MFRTIVKNNYLKLLRISSIRYNYNLTITQQFPESLPGLESSRDEAGSKSNDTSSTSESEAKTERCTLNGLRNGLLGKLEILKSGRARLRLGEMSFFVDIGALQRFQQV